MGNGAPSDEPKDVVMDDAFFEGLDNIDMFLHPPQAALPQQQEPPAPKTIEELPPRGVDILIDPSSEWKIQEISFDGCEKFLRPETHIDRVGRLARKLDWRNIIDRKEPYENDTLLPEHERELESDDDEKAKKDEKIKLDVVPEAGPWHVVARSLHEALAQINVFVDTLRITQSFDYLKPLAVADPTGTAPTHVQNEIANVGRGFQWNWKRKALLEVQKQLDTALKRRTRNINNEDPTDMSWSTLFFRELVGMRKNWRIRKIGDFLHGDLGFRIYGQKFLPNELFDILRRPEPVKLKDRHGHERETIVQIYVPCDLMRRTTLTLSIIDNEADFEFFTRVRVLDQKHLKVDKRDTKDIYWCDALHWAQETLINRSIFRQLADDAVKMERRAALVSDDCLIVKIHEDIFLRIEMFHHPFNADPIPPDGDQELLRQLKALFFAQENRRYIRTQMFVDLPLTTLSEQLDLRGPMSFTQEDMNRCARVPQHLLQRLIDVAAHKRLVHTAVEVLTQHQIDSPDPQMKWRWMRTSPIQTTIAVHITNPHFDYLMGKVTYYIRVSTDAIKLVTKEGHTIDCHRSAEHYRNTLRFMDVQYFMTATITLGRMCWTWHVLHANINQMTDRCVAPTLYMCNATSSRVLLVQFPMDGEPIVKVQKLTKKPGVFETPFKKLVYAKIPGDSLCKKMDNLFALMRD